MAIRPPAGGTDRVNPLPVEHSTGLVTQPDIQSWCGAAAGSAVSIETDDGRIVYRPTPPTGGLWGRTVYEGGRIVAEEAAQVCAGHPQPGETYDLLATVALGAATSPMVHNALQTASTVTLGMPLEFLSLILRES